MSAYQTLYTCLMTVAKLLAPFAPFYADELYHDLGGELESVHLDKFPVADEAAIDADLEERMAIAQKITSMVLALRRTDYTLEYDVKAFNLEEARRVINTRPQKLSLQEMYMVANSYPKGSEEYNNVFDTAVKMFPEDKLANLNAALAAIDRGDKVSAEKYSSLPFG